MIFLALQVGDAGVGGRTVLRRLERGGVARDRTNLGFNVTACGYAQYMERIGVSGPGLAAPTNR